MSRFERRFRRTVPGVGQLTGYSGMPPDKDEAAKLVLEQAKQAGCTCSPDISVDSAPRPGAMTHVRVEHDEWCPLVRGQ